MRSIEVNLRKSDTRLVLRYRIEGDVDKLLVPVRAASRRAAELWRHTCAEAFVRAPAHDGYIELNFSPSTEWAAYRFGGYRSGMSDVEKIAPRTDIRCDSKLLEIVADVDLQAVSEIALRSGLELALSAVVEEANGRISYWAAAHPSAQPDFHHAGGFVVRV